MPHVAPCDVAGGIIDSINIAAWVAVGCALGWLAGKLKPSPDRMVFIENMATGVFGAFVGGEFVNAMVRANPRDTSVSLMAVVLALGCSVAALLLLALMRRKVGPLRSGKPKRR